MNSTHEVISAFLDDEPFDPQELANALSETTGRALLIDLMALRRIVQPSDAVPTISAAKPKQRLVWRIGAPRRCSSRWPAAGIWSASDAP